MSRHRLLSLPLALVAVLTLAATTLAGGWATVEAAGPTDGQAAGSETIIELEVLQHGVTAVSWPRITVNAANAETGKIISAAATPIAGETGRYTATLTFPTEGTWTLSYASPDLYMEGTAKLAISAPVVAAAAAADSAAAVDPALTIGLAAVVLVFLLALAGLVIHDRRSDRREQPTAVGG